MDCCFCKEHQNPLQSQFYLQIGNKINRISRILCETENWYAIPSIGSLTVGYVLLVCKQHHLSLATLSKDLFDEMLQLKAQVEAVLFRELGLQCITFEHGITHSEANGANSVDHIHIHVLPFSGPIWSSISSHFCSHSFSNVNSYEELYKSWLSEKPHSYLLFQDTDERIYYISNAENMPSQLFRRQLAPYLGAECWDWRSEQYLDNIIKTIQLFENTSSN